VSTHLPRIIITSGEPAGIGLDLCCALAFEALPASLTVIADQVAMAQRAEQLGLKISWQQYRPEESLPHRGEGKLTVLHEPAVEPVQSGRLNPANGSYVLRTLNIAIDCCLGQEFDGMVTCPVHKGVINDAGIAFTGHTEYLAERCGISHVVMMLAGGGMRVALATTHIPLAHVSSAITQESLRKTLQILHHDLVHRFNIHQPRVLVAGLNPHAGEGGYLGNEEIAVITPVLDSLRGEGMQLIGPLPADTLFTPHHLQQADCVLAMYHDQGLPVLKHASFGEGVNITLGLPIIRTSVDHGTALDLAGTGKANPGSLFTAIHAAIELINNRNTG
jgi:4-hydroxythreonine-4-phosphate dehydrogenase